MASLTADEATDRRFALIDLAVVRDVSLGHIEIRDPFAWITFVEGLLKVKPGRPVPAR